MKAHRFTLLILALLRAVRLRRRVAKCPPSASTTLGAAMTCAAKRIDTRPPTRRPMRVVPQKVEPHRTWAYGTPLTPKICHVRGGWSAAIAPFTRQHILIECVHSRRREFTASAPPTKMNRSPTPR